ncbi:class II histocompatibility antigen, B-L beta chain-like [Passer montanus]|uniref:class II histocompatibility antigen, B-L beta chain-like n=1 Tax=Passer montanus TaxID=9160 RepID=UPI00195F7B65|nr:class II histocompatibility antigen, B-L beta chain-like [Passer montanus]
MNGTERVKYAERHSYNREQLLHFDCDFVGHFVGFTPFGEKVAGYRNSLPDFLRLKRTAVLWYWRSNSEVAAVFLTERRVPIPPCPSRWCPRAPSPAPAACSAP